MLRKERRQTRRLPIELSGDVRPVFFSNDQVRMGMPIPCRITNIGSGGLNVNLGNPLDAGTRVFITTKIHGKRLEFYAMVRYAHIAIDNSTPVYAHGLQITTAFANVMDEFQYIINEFIQNGPKNGVVHSEVDEAVIGADEDIVQNGGSSIVV